MPPRLDLIFDLDGTLWDPARPVAAGWNAALAVLQPGRIVTEAAIRGICGMPFEACVRTLFPEVKSQDLPRWLEALDRCEEQVFREQGGVLYPGVREGLIRLAAQHTLYLVSNCQAWYRDAFFRWYPDLRSHFLRTLCYGDTGQSKAANLRELLPDSGVRAAAFYIGDTAGDETAAREAGCGFFYAAYGFGKLDGATRIEQFSEIEALVSRTRR